MISALPIFSVEQYHIIVFDIDAHVFSTLVFLKGDVHAVESYLVYINFALRSVTNSISPNSITSLSHTESVFLPSLVMVVTRCDPFAPHVPLETARWIFGNSALFM